MSSQNILMQELVRLRTLKRLAGLMATAPECFSPGEDCIDAVMGEEIEYVGEQFNAFIERVAKPDEDYIAERNRALLSTKESISE